MADYKKRHGTCAHYLNPKVIRNYPNCNNEALGWRTCRVGNTIKKDTIACINYMGPDNDKERRTLVQDEGPLKRRLIP